LVAKLPGKRPFERPWIMLKGSPRNGMVVSIGFSWLRVGSCEYETTGFHKVIGISLVAEQLLASEAPYSTE
jgi:hypothetical protein